MHLLDLAEGLTGSEALHCNFDCHLKLLLARYTSTTRPCKSSLPLYFPGHTDLVSPAVSPDPLPHRPPEPLVPALL